MSKLSKLIYKKGGGSSSPDFMEETKKRWTSRRRSGIICLCVLLVIVFLLSPVFDVKQILVNGNVKTTAESIISASGIVEGASIFKVNTGKSEKRLTTMAFVDAVQVKLKFPSTVEINITESKEAAYIYFIGNYVGIDENGKILEIKQKDDEISLPVIIGTDITEFGIGNYIKTDDEQKQEVIYKLIKQISSTGIAAMIKTIDVSDLNDIRFFTVSEATVTIGTMDDIIYKVSFLKKILEEPGDKRGAVIDMTNTEKVTFTGS